MKLADDCFVHDKDRMRHADALDLLRGVKQDAAFPPTLDGVVGDEKGCKRV